MFIYVRHQSSSRFAELYHEAERSATFSSDVKHLTVSVHRYVHDRINTHMCMQLYNLRVHDRINTRMWMLLYNLRIDDRITTRMCMQLYNLRVHDRINTRICCIICE